MIDFKTLTNSLPKLKASWDETFILEALSLSVRCDCTSRRFGAIIVSGKNRIVSAGYNAPPKGVMSAAQSYLNNNPQADFVPRHACYKLIGNGGEYKPDQSYDFCPALHAEQNAILEIGIRELQQIPDCRLYLAGRDGQTNQLIDAKPCIHCARIIIQSGIKYVTYLTTDGEIKTISTDSLKITPIG